MSENEPRPSENPYGSQPPTNPYGQPVPPSSSESSSEQPSDRSAGSSSLPSPEGAHSSSQSGYPTPQGGYPPSQAGYPTGPYGTNPYAAGPYGGHGPRGDVRPGTVTAAGWITIVLSALSTLMFLLLALIFVVAQEPMVDEMRRQPEFDELDVDPGSIVGLLVAVMIVLALWSAIGVVLGVFVLRRSNVARILLVISSAVVALISLALILTGITAVTLAAAAAVILLLFVGGANDWFARRGSGTPYGGSPYGGSPYGDPGSPYGGSHDAHR